MQSGAEHLTATKEDAHISTMAIAKDAIEHYGQGDVRSVSVAPIVQHFAFDTFDVETQLVERK